ncbi:MAG: hypothetical protein AMXMBFR64_37660 [Myxococcales bacterium]
MSRLFGHRPHAATSHLRAVASATSDATLLLVRTIDGVLVRTPISSAGLDLPGARVVPGEGGALIHRRGAEVLLVDGERVGGGGSRLTAGAVIQVGRARWVALSSRQTASGDPYCALVDMLGGDDASIAALEQVALLARTSAPILITGESGTGKEVAAHAIHALGARAARPLVALNCAALPESLAEAELFGWARGAFTGATEARQGLFERADGGALFLDEVGELSPAMQARLLRVLDTGEVRRVGERETRRVDVRIVSATHRDLPAAVRAGTFRMDLLYRLRVLHLSLPPLRARPGDIAALSEAMLRRMGCGGLTLSRAALDVLRHHPWLGNVRELRNVLQRAAVLTAGPVIEPCDLHLDEAAPPLDAAVPPPLHPLSPAVPQRRIVEELLRQGGHRRRAYEALDIPRSTFYRWMQQNRQVLAAHGLDGPDGRARRGWDGRAG